MDEPKYFIMFAVVVSVDSSPGPRYNIDAKVTRFGRMETPSYSMLGRGKRTGETLSVWIEG